MSSVTTKNLILSQPKIGQEEEISSTVLSHTSTLTEDATVVRIEIPGVDPSSVDVNFEDNNLLVSCERGQLTLPVNPTIDVAKIKADILWGMLTLTIPLPTPPESRTIKVSVYDSEKRV